MKNEFTVKPFSCYLALLLTVLFLGGAIGGFFLGLIWPGAILTGTLHT